MAETRSYLAIFTIILTVFGIGVLTVSEAWGVTIIFFSILFLGGYIVRNRLQAIGAAQFALGSIIVWIGFVILSLPLLDFAWGFVDQSYQLFLFIAGLVLIAIGFTTEMLDLNAKFLALITKVRLNFSETWKTIRTKLFRSIWTGFAVIFLLLAIVSLFTSVIDFIPNPLPISWGRSLIFFLLALICIAIEFRAVIILAVTTSLEFIKLVSIAVFSRLRNVPGLVIDFFQLVYGWIVNALRWVYQIIPTMVQNIYVFGFGGSVIFGLFAYLRSDTILGAGSIVLLLISLINLVATRQDEIERRVAGIQQSTYSRSLRLKNLIRREYTGKCSNCGIEMKSGQNYCMNCGQFTPDCMVCRSPIFEGEETLVCPTCDVAGHANHLERWLSIKPTCPNCREKWS